MHSIVSNWRNSIICKDTRVLILIKRNIVISRLWLPTPLNLLRTRNERTVIGEREPVGDYARVSNETTENLTLAQVCPPLPPNYFRYFAPQIDDTNLILTLQLLLICTSSLTQLPPVKEFTLRDNANT